MPRVHGELVTIEHPAASTRSFHRTLVVCAVAKPAILKWASQRSCGKAFPFFKKGKGYYGT
jgi:hypothetical protein